MNKIKEWLIQLICEEIQAGGWCGLCGIWIDYELFPVSWPYGVCKKCRNLTPREADPPLAKDTRGPGAEQSTANKWLYTNPAGKLTQISWADRSKRV